MKVLYKPLGILAGIIGAKLGTRLFQALWDKIDGSEPPGPTVQEAAVGKVVGAAALHAATKAGTKAATERASARSFHYLFGIWPGKEEEEEEESKREEEGR
ncbi:MAG: DUF4235 domain-containing protein [Solirubrobacterales bacterium]|nr:DUF4235 domain-containing protein [Solirubrobacterales bacterium]MBV8942844.1 DUF4235 domain-containing protein [Solirubrobacterales bacterium]MBV9165897.1 DUF4235 domain-containing protein [Solirubrobacterales bacterium]